MSQFPTVDESSKIVQQMNNHRRLFNNCLVDYDSSATEDTPRKNLFSCNRPNKYLFESDNCLFVLNEYLCKLYKYFVELNIH